MYSKINLIFSLAEKSTLFIPLGFEQKEEEENEEGMLNLII